MKYALLLLVLLVPGLAHADPAGLWLNEPGTARIQIAQCDGGTLCGRIVWLAEPNRPDGTPKVDINNPDEAKRTQGIIGLALLSGFRAAATAGQWEGGTIYNPEDGQTYKATLTEEGAERLRVRGYVGLPMFGKTQIWIRAR